jgi:hypothetical protein
MSVAQIVGLLSPVAMHFIVIFGGEFYSANCMYVPNISRSSLASRDGTLH